MRDEQQVQRIEAALRDEGWADHVSLARELRVWARLSDVVNTYTATVDDYTNDLCSRDYLAEVLSRASSDLGITIEEHVAQADDAFRESTVEDADGRQGYPRWHPRIPRQRGAQYAAIVRGRGLAWAMTVTAWLVAADSPTPAAGAVVHLSPE